MDWRAWGLLSMAWPLSKVGANYEHILPESANNAARRLGAGWHGLARAAVAAVLAHVREDAPGLRAARQLGSVAGQEPAMSWLRFRRLMQAGTDDEQITAFRRAVALAKGRLNVADLGGSLLAWDDERRRRWIYEYHAVAAPPGNQEDTAA